MLLGMAMPATVSAAQTGEKGMKIVNGSAQPIVQYSDARAEGYSNDNSDILRFSVCVETDYDTDLDGKPDLIKAYVQVPRAAAEGYYKAPVIYEARPYTMGKNYSGFTDADETVDDEQLKAKPAKRTPSGSVTTLQAASQENMANWNVTFGTSSTIYPIRIGMYNYSLVRGFAVIQAAGLGTYGSEGILCTGTEMETQAFKSVIEWLNGKRKAYTNLTDNKEISADWSNGKVGMIGGSYSGSAAFAVATTGVEGLETIVPIAGVSSWYDYSNSQGMVRGFHPAFDYTSRLMQICSSRLLKDYTAEQHLTFDKYSTYVKNTQVALQGSYGEFWDRRDYFKNSNIKASALLIQGLNDTNVTPKQFDLMRDAFLKSGTTVKAVLHQNAHANLFNFESNYDIIIGDVSYSEYINRWFSHYLAGADNNVQNLPSFTVQSNQDGKFYSAEDWKTGVKTAVYPYDASEHKVDANDAHMMDNLLLSDTFKGKSNSNALLWKREITSPITLNGPTEVHVRAKTDDIDKGEIIMSAVLVDRADSPFNFYVIPEGRTTLGRTIIKEKAVEVGGGHEPYDIAEWNSSMITSKIVAEGSIDLRNPEAGYEPSTAVTRSEPIKKGEYYDYTIWLNPNYYTVAAGHHLELYIVPFCSFSMEMSYYELGYTSSNNAPITHDYSFTVDNSQSYTLISTTEENPFLMGDSNLDGIVSIKDASDIQKAAIGLINLNSMSKKVGDVNGDGKLTVSDTTCIQRYLSNYKNGIGKTGKAS